MNVIIEKDINDIGNVRIKMVKGEKGDPSNPLIIDSDDNGKRYVMNLYVRNGHCVQVFDEYTD